MKLGAPMIFFFKRLRLFRRESRVLPQSQDSKFSNGLFDNDILLSFFNIVSADLQQLLLGVHLYVQQFACIGIRDNCQICIR